MLAGAVVLAGCGEDPLDVDQVLADACGDAEATLAQAPAPADDDARVAFVEAAGEATETVATAIADVEGAVDEQALRDLRWQLDNFPTATGEDDALRVAHEGSAAITRIDRFAEALGVGACGAAAWRPADWRAMAERIAGEPDEADFRRDVDSLCAATFPNPELVQADVPLVPALVGREEPGDDDIGMLLSRLDTLDNRPATANQFIRDFSDGLVELQPSDGLESEYTALVAAFMGIDAAVPRVVPDDPSPEFRSQIEAVFEELERAWSDLDIAC